MVSQTIQALNELGERKPYEPVRKKDGKSFFHSLPPLPYPMDALQPIFSPEAVEYHYLRHHTAYIDKMNSLIEGTELETAPLEEIIQKASGVLLNQAGQVWNHTFFWHCLRGIHPVLDRVEPEAAAAKEAPHLFEKLQKTFGSFSEFKKQFEALGLQTFGSGWVWLVKDEKGALSLMSTSNAGTPLREGKKPLYTCDVWEHAYYLDYKYSRARYLSSYWDLCNWSFLESQFLL